MCSRAIPILLLISLFAGCTVNPQDLSAPANSGANAIIGAPAAQADGAGVQSPQAKLFTIAEVARHNTKQDCWMVINGKVLDLSPYTSHPGGDTYVPYCGTEATQAYNDEGGRGRSHSAYATEQMGSYVIGEIGNPANST